MFSFTPLLAQAACGTLDFRSVVEPVHSDRQIEFHHGWCDGVDFTEQTLDITPTTTPQFSIADPLVAPSRSANTGTTAASSAYKLRYDMLLISIGSYNATFGTRGVKENAMFLKSAADARAIRWRIYHCFDDANRLLHTGGDEQAVRDLLSFVVVGGGPTGAEFAAELHDLVTQDLARVYPQLRTYASFTLLDAGTKILSSFDKSLSEHAMRKFARDGIDVRLSQKIRAVEPDGIVLARGEGEEKVKAGMVVWSTGITTSPLIDALRGVVKDDKSGKLVVNDQLQLLIDPSANAYGGAVDGASSTGTTAVAESPSRSVLPNVFAVGDCAVQQSGASPATAQVASQQGAFLGSLLNRRLITPTTPANNNLPSFKWYNKGSMASLGSSEALIDSPNPLVGKEAGRLAWIAWRAAYTFMNMTTRNRFLVPANWVSNWIFGRDVGRI